MSPIRVASSNHPAVHAAEAFAGAAEKKKVTLGGLKAAPLKLSPALSQDLKTLEKNGEINPGTVFARAFKFDNPAALAQALADPKKAKDVLYMAVNGRFASPHSDATDPDVSKDLTITAAKPGDVLPFLNSELAVYDSPTTKGKLTGPKSALAAALAHQPGVTFLKLQWDPNSGWENSYNALVAVNKKTGTVQLLSVGHEG